MNCEQRQSFPFPYEIIISEIMVWFLLFSYLAYYLKFVEFTL